MERKHGVGRRTIIKALSSAWPEPRKKLPPRPSKLGPYKPAMDEILRADLDAPRKQRHTVTRIFHRLIDERGMTEVSYPVVRAYVAERKPQIRAEAGREPRRRSTSARSWCGWPASRSSATCFASGCRFRARRCTDLLTALPARPPGLP